MKTILTIDGEQLTAEDIVTFLKFSNEFDSITEKITEHKLLVQAGKSHAFAPSQDDLQEVADDFRRFSGLHRAKDTQEWLDGMKVTVDDFEDFLTELVIKNKMLSEITAEKHLEEYFAQHSPDFDTVDIQHILLDDEAKANEIKALLEDDPDMFNELVLEHSIDEDTKYLQGKMSHIRKGTLAPEQEAKIFNASAGDILGPIKLGDEDFYEIVLVNSISAATMNEDVEEEVGTAVKGQWLSEKMKNVSISLG